MPQRTVCSLQTETVISNSLIRQGNLPARNPGLLGNIYGVIKVRYIDELNLQGKTVFIRADLNVPFDKSGAIADDNRIQASIPTIDFALKHGAKVILASHLGRPKGEQNPAMSLKPVAKRIHELTKANVIMAEDCVGKDVQSQAANLKTGEILLLENLRFHKEEEKNDPQFSQQLAALAEVYINDAFATAHRAHASTAGMTIHFKEKAGGFTLKSELEYFKKAFENPARPLIAIFGGAKVSTKMEAIKNVGKQADAILIGGAMANTFFVADGLAVGKSLYEPQEVENARAIKAQLQASGCKLVLPEDVVVAKELKGGVPTSVVPINQISDEMMALDIGVESVKKFKAALVGAGTIIWNGPMGAFETEEFSSGTYQLVEALVASPALTVVGGGDTDLALHRAHAFDKMDYVSTAGGAFLELLEGKTLPGVAALES